MDTISRMEEWKSVKEVLLDTLKDDLSKLVYHYSDGISSREIVKKYLSAA